MTKLRFKATALAFMALGGLSTVHAQQDAPAAPSANQSGALDDSNAPTGSKTDQAERYEARRVSNDSNQTGHALTVTHAIAEKLHKSNQAEIELARLALQKSDNQEIKQLSQTIIQDHQACNQKLQQIAGQNQRSGDKQTHSPSAFVPKQLVQIAEQACENALQMTKEMLSQYEGQDFNRAFLGQQIVAHTMMLAELQAIESTGPQELQPIAQEASTKVEEHLKTAKQIANRLEDDRKSRS